MTDKNEIMVPRQAYWVSLYHGLVLVASVMIVIMFELEKLNVKDCVRLMIYAAALGSSGGALNASRTVVWAVRRESYETKFLLWQILTPIHSGFLAVVGLVLIRGGMMALTNTDSNVTPTEAQYSWAIMGFSFFIGFSSEVFIKKLRAAAEALFGERGLDGEQTNHTSESSTDKRNDGGQNKS